MYSLHPAVVHFPIGLLVLSTVLEAIGFATGRADFSRFSWWSQIAGVLGLAIAVVTGLIAGNRAIPTPPGRAALDIHEQLALLTAASVAALFLWRIAKKGKVPPDAPRVYLVALGMSTLLLLTTAWFGGELVFRYAIGVRTP